MTTFPVLLPLRIKSSLAEHGIMLDTVDFDYHTSEVMLKMDRSETDKIRLVSKLINHEFEKLPF
jgi:hypothetical protein